MPYDERNRARGLAFIIYDTHREAKNALKAGYRGVILKNRNLSVEIFKPLETLKMERKDKKEGYKIVASKKQKAVLFMPKPKNTSEKD